MAERRHHLFKSAEQRQDEADEARAARQAREEERRRKEAEATPEGRARTAFERGLGWFETRLDLGGAELTLIENEGWSLVDVNHVFVPHHAHGSGGEAGSAKYTIDGAIVGVYMFRRDASKRQAQS